MLIDLSEIRSFSEDVTIEIPLDAHPESVKIEASLTGNLLGPIMENVERLITMPEGCGEQKIKSFALAVYTYKYLKSLNQEHSQLAENALTSIRKGYEIAREMQTFDGGFKLWGSAENSEGIWLSAYITQILGDAQDLIEINPQFYERCLGYIKSKQRNGGFFEDDNNNPRKMPGSPELRKIYLTAFAMIAIAKNTENYDDYAYVNNDGARYLSRMNLNNDYERAIVAYALSLSGESAEASSVLNTITWIYEKISKNKIKALQVEIASYITLAAVNLNRFEEARRAVDWLIKQRKQHGGFFSTHDTVLGLEALAAYQNTVNFQKPLMNIRFNDLTESIESKVDSKFVKIPANLRHLNVQASGHGIAYVNVFYQYKLKRNQSKMINLVLSGVETTESGIKLNFKVGSQKTNMAVVEIELPSGFEYSRGSFTDDVKKIESNDDKTKVFLYFDSITTSTYRRIQTIEGRKIFDVRDKRKSLIKVYDYYEPDQFNAYLFYESEVNTCNERGN